MKLGDKATKMMLVKFLKEIESEEYLDIACDKGIYSDLNCDSCEYHGNDCVYAIIAEGLMKKGVKIDFEREVQEDA